MGDTTACRISRYSIFILMLMFYSLLAQVLQLAVKIDRDLSAITFLRLYADYGDYINWYEFRRPHKITPHPHDM
jgi:hypothetical protein